MIDPTTHAENVSYIADELLLDFTAVDPDTTNDFLTSVEFYTDRHMSTNQAIDHALEDAYVSSDMYTWIS